jgi:hypothetical protein
VTGESDQGRGAALIDLIISGAGVRWTAEGRAGDNVQVST